MTARDIPASELHGPPVNPQWAAKRLAASAVRKGYAPEALHTYADLDGNPLYWRIRAKHPVTGEKWIRPMRREGIDYVLREPAFPDGKPLYRLRELVSGDASMPIYFVEGEPKVDALLKLGLRATTSGSASSDDKTDYEPLRGQHVILWADNDAPGRDHMQRVAVKLQALGCIVQTVDIDALALPAHGDAIDYLSDHPNAIAADLLGLAVIAADHTGTGTASVWPDPKPIIAELKPVPAFDAAVLLPRVLRDWIIDESERMPCPPDFVAVATLVALGSIIGAHCAIKPKSRDSWQVVPNLWGGIVGNPAAKKTPAWGAALKAMDRLVATANKSYEDALSDFETAKIVFDAQKGAIEGRIKEAARYPKKGNPASIAKELREHQDQGPDMPKPRRYRTNDSTVEKLGELLRDNPHGLLVMRDELVGLIASWEREGREGDRAFFLEAWNGDQSFDTDRIGRGHISIPNLCVSIFGGIQPDKLIGYLEQAANALANDGMLQRFQLLAYPDPRRWEWRDRAPNKTARDAAFAVFTSLAEFDPVAFGATPADDFSKFPYFRFDEEAQKTFIEWSTDLHQVRVPAEDQPIIQQHLTKFDKLFPALALIFHLVDCATNRVYGSVERDSPENWLNRMKHSADGTGGPVSKEAAMRAAAWCEYLEAHARRCYGLLADDGLRSAQALANKVQQGKLGDGFTARDVRRNQWRCLTTDDAVQAGLDWLEDEGWLRSAEVGGSGPGTGRPTFKYQINPAIAAKSKADAE